jgi:hypothetical protein
VPGTVEVEGVRNGTNVRRGGSTEGRPDDVIGVIDRGTYRACVRCAREQIVEGSPGSRPAAPSSAIRRPESA